MLREAGLGLCGPPGVRAARFAALTGVARGMLERLGRGVRGLAECAGDAATSALRLGVWCRDARGVLRTSVAEVTTAFEPSDERLRLPGVCSSAAEGEGAGGA